MLLTVEEGHLRLDGCSLHQGAHHHRQILLKLLPQDLTHPGPGWDHVWYLKQNNVTGFLCSNRKNKYDFTVQSSAKFSYLWIIIFQVIEVCLGFEKQLHDSRGIWHELATERTDMKTPEAWTKALKSITPQWIVWSPCVHIPSPCQQPGQWDWCTLWSCHGAAGAPSALRFLQCVSVRAWTGRNMAQTSPQLCLPLRQWMSPPAPRPVWCPSGLTGKWEEETWTGWQS